MCPVETSGNGFAAAWLAAIVDSSDDVIVSKTLDGVIMSWNQAAEKIFGYTAAEAIGQHITLIIPYDRRAEEDDVLATIRRGEKVDHFETIRRAKDGRLLNISLTVSPVRDALGRIIGVSKVARDITERKRLERERDEQLLLLEKEVAAREKAQAELAEAVTARDDFIAVAAHELRNPLNVLALTLQLVHRVSRNIVGSAEIRERIEKSQLQLGRISTLMDRLFDVTRIQSGSFELYRQKFNLTCLIREVVARIVGESSVSIPLDLEPSIEGTWDRLRIDQALTNLISNAIKYGMQKPIWISARVNDSHTAIVSVRDEGIGISSEDLKRIFDRFQRAAPRLGNQGLGLGLWITKQIVEAHGGTIFAKSEPGNGSVFTMMLPLQYAVTKE
jgi:PAS domain S-box-containing protein